jgi:4-hydroxy-2-oxoheptanedioate aldolase
VGVPGRSNDENFVRAIDRVVKAAENHGKALGVLVMSVDETKLWIGRGFRCISFGGDLWLYGGALAPAFQCTGPAQRSQTLVLPRPPQRRDAEDDHAEEEGDVDHCL